MPGYFDGYTGCDLAIDGYDSKTTINMPTIPDYKKCNPSYELYTLTVKPDKTVEKLVSEIVRGVPVCVPKIKKVIFNPPATVVLWEDGEKTVVKAHEEAFSEEHGLAMAIAKRYFGNNRSKFKKAVKDGKRNEQ